MSTRVSCGRDFHCCPNINDTLDQACKSGFDFVCFPIVNPVIKREFIHGPAKDRPGAITRSDMLLTGQDWNSLVALRQELTFASHLAIPSVLIPLKNGNITNLARILNEHLVNSYANQQYWIHVPTMSPRDQIDPLIEGQTEEIENPEDTWTWWHKFRTLCDSHKRVSVCLELTPDMPSVEVQKRWLAEPVKSCSISTSLFLTNKRGYPVLTRAHQIFILMLFKLEVQIIITGTNRHLDKGIHTYQQYLDHLFQTQPPPDPVAQFAKGYEDYLQSPLQPLMDNLESQTYEIFEKDPVKYSQYQKAVYHALLDKVKPEERDTKEIVLMVVGAGRGPLVRASIAAAQQAGRKVKKIYAVEKNPNAVITLENMKDEMWGDQVEVISCDMRKWEAPQKADILVSELLGSFADNELSPECLDGAQRFLKEDGISIPCEYTSFLAPLQSEKLHNEVRNCKDKDKQPDVSIQISG
ncbi:HSL7 [Mytilus edulis]|uniref:Protein arginine N-methyltransferase 5 n=1 Tax=Mytilus edulis TaxID=6550 RepID=A0A8S3U4I1_MYTED|nr:HSL7 [Mytilus edulis]